MFSIANIVEYFNHLGTAGSTLLLALVGSGAWLFQKFASYLLWEFTRRGRIIEIANALKSEITDLKSGIEREFTHENRQEILAKLDQLAREKKPRALMLAATDDNFIFDSLKQEFSKLPLSALSSVLAFYNANKLFLETYKRQATELFAKSSLDDQKLVVNENFQDAEACKTTSLIAIKSLEKIVSRNYLVLMLIAVGLAFFAVWILQLVQLNIRI